MNVYQIVTDRIISELEKGKIPWKKPWKGQKAINYVTRKPYHGINTILLPFPGEYLTFKQAKDAGGNIKKGEKSSLIVFFKWLEKQNDEGETNKFPMLNYYNVFHISQCEGIESKSDSFNPEGDNEEILTAEQLVNDYIKRETINYLSVKGSDRAYYSPSDDSIVMPHLNQFTSSNSFYGTFYHEMIHSTGHRSRLDRFSKQKTHAFGSQDYSKEELVAEIGSAFLMNMTDLETEDTQENNTAYLQSWLKALKNDTKMIVSASSQAQKAVEFITTIN